MMQEAKTRHFGLLRELRVADWMTLLNGVAGMSAVFAFLDFCITHSSPSLWWGGALLVAALLLDILDGRVARKLKESSEVGRELDSLADVVSFGVAPAVLGYSLGLRGGWDLVLLTVFLACGISRLARYNVTAVGRSDDTGKVRYFEGLPIPSSLLLVAIFLGMHAAGNSLEHLPLGDLELGPATFHPISILFLLHGFAMVSRTIRIPKP
jgi:CDP-diacylglycerol--serine O-phosphatidyltransferase